MHPLALKFEGDDHDSRYAFRSIHAAQEGAGFQQADHGNLKGQQMIANRASPKAAKKRVTTGKRKVAAKPAAGRRRKEMLVVTEGQRRNLIEDAAFFRAERYRKVEPGQCREEDRCEAAAELETVIKRNQP